MATDPHSTSSTLPPPATSTNDPPLSSTLSSLHAYPFTTDPAFLSGLAQIFGHPGTAVTEAELTQKPDLVLSAKCFYFSRKFQTPTPIEPAAYKQWLSSSQTSLSQSIVTPSIHDAVTSTRPPDPAGLSLSSSSAIQLQSQSGPSTSASTTTTATTEQQPPYPTSFAAIVDLITNNKPVPGIEDIPTTVLEPGSSKQDQATRRRKPWEKDVETDTVSGGVVDGEWAGAEHYYGIDATEASGSHDEGLLRLLRPDAVPGSGLVAKD